MKTRICPLCDQPMKKAHRCDSCHSFIWKPMYIDIHYSTGSMSGPDCSYDAMEHEYSYHEDGSVTSMPSEEKHRWERHKKAEEQSDSEFREVYGSQKAERKKASGRGRLIAIVIAACMLFTSLPGLARNLMKEFEIGFKTPESGGGNDIFFSDDDFSADSYGDMAEFTDEEVMARGEECTGNEHMDIIWEDFQPRMEQGLEDLGGDITDYSDGSDNYGYFYGGDDSRTYFNQSRMYHLDGDVGSYLNISWDTDSKRLHEVSYAVFSEEAAENLFTAVMNALDGDGEGFRKEFTEQKKDAEKDGYVFYYTDIYEIYISYDAESYSGEVSYYISITKAL